MERIFSSKSRFVFSLLLVIYWNVKLSFFDQGIHKTFYLTVEGNVMWCVQVRVPCHILQSTKDLAVPVVVAKYLHHALGGPSIVEVLPTEGHLPQLSSPEIVIPALKRHIVGSI